MLGGEPQGGKGKSESDAGGRERWVGGEGGNGSETVACVSALQNVGAGSRANFAWQLLCPHCEP